MTMHEHDQEIILALAEGSLDPEAAERAAAEIARCAECSRDLEMQRVALNALGDAPRVYLTATESARLHDRLHRELAVMAPKQARSRTPVSWPRWAGFAFGTAAAFLAVFLVLPALLGGGGDDSAETVAFDETVEDVGADGADMRSATTAAAAPSPAQDIARLRAALGHLGVLLERRVDQLVVGDEADPVGNEHDTHVVIDQLVLIVGDHVVDAGQHRTETPRVGEIRVIDDLGDVVGARRGWH